MSERPSGGISGVLYDYSRQLHAVQRHASAEGNDVTTNVILDSYYRQLHPWAYGRRPFELAQRVREWWSSLSTGGRSR